MSRRTAATISVLAVVAAGSAVGGQAFAADRPSPTEVIQVDTAEELESALAEVQAGDTIELADGTYEDQFVATTSGTRAEPIRVVGSRDAVLDGGGADSGYGFHLDGADHWILRGFTITNSKKGVIGDEVNGTVLDSVAVHHIGEEAIHFRCGSSWNAVRDSEIFDTGTEQPEYGEGIYFGHAESNWETCEDGGSDTPDNSDYNKAIGNTIGPDVRAESIDIKEGTTGGVIRDNVFDGTGMAGENYADSWMDVKGNDYLIVGNEGTNALLDGFQTHQILDGWGENNVFDGNTADVGADGYGFNIDTDDDDASGNVVCSNNQVSNAGSGAANIPQTDC